MWDRWFVRDSYYSHGILIPFVSGFLIWQQRSKLTDLPQIRSRWAVPLIIAGLTIHLISSVLRVYFSSGFSMIIVLSGLILYFYGSAVFKKISFPVAFLIFMVPIPLVVISGISFKLKIFAAELSETILNNLRLPAIREGSMIKMRHTYIMVDDVCSGLRSLISLTALASIFAFWLRGGIAKKVVVFLSSIPIAIITNVFRIVLLSAISEIWGAQYAMGFTHDFTGFLVFALAFVLLFMVVKLLE